MYYRKCTGNVFSCLRRRKIHGEGNEAKCLRVCRPSVNCLSVCPWRDAILSEWISMKLGSHIHRVSGHCWKVFQGQRSKVKVTIRRQTLRLCVASTLTYFVLCFIIVYSKENLTIHTWVPSIPLPSSPLLFPHLLSLIPPAASPSSPPLHLLHLSSSLRSRYPLFQLYAPQAGSGRITAEIDFGAF